MLLDMAALIEKQLDREVSLRRGVSFREYRLLKCLSLFHDNTAMRVELAGQVGLTPSAVTRALKPLEKIGYVTTQKSERDARRSLATLTDAGLELLRDTQSIIDDTIEALPLDAAMEVGLSALLRNLRDSSHEIPRSGRRS